MDDHQQTNSTPQKTKPKNHPVKIDDEYLSQNCIEKCINEFNKIKSGEHNSPLEIITTKKVLEVDPLLVAYFILFKKEIDNLEIILKLHDDTPENIKAKVGQYKVHAHITSGENIFKLPKYESESEIIKPQWFVWSEKFMPITFIDEKNFNVAFIDKVFFLPIVNKIKFLSESDKLYISCKDFLFNYVRPDERGMNILSQLAFYKALFQANILTIHLFQEIEDVKTLSEEILNKNNINIGNLSSKVGIQYYSDILELIFNELRTKPPIYQFIFSALISSDLLPSGQLLDNNVDQFKKVLLNLWNFTNKLVSGLYELAKNIIEHSDTKIGVITGRIYKEEIFSELQKNNLEAKKLLAKYFDEILKKEDRYQKAFMVINVIDSGNKGVIEKLKDDIDQPNSRLKDEHDLNLIKQGEIVFQHLLDSSKGIILNQQAKRAFAHFGLLVFSKLIEDNNGMVRAGTYSLNRAVNLRDNALVLPTNISNLFNRSSFPLCPFGTNYNFILPLDPNAPLISIETNKSSISHETTPAMMQSIENLLNYQIIKDPKENDERIKSGRPSLFITNPLNVKPLLNRQEEEEFFNYTFQYLSPELKKIINSVDFIERAIMCLNFENVKIDTSQLFRLIGRWELEYPGCPLIIYNIPNSVYDKLDILNYDYLNYLQSKVKINLPYWFDDSIVIIYNYTSEKDEVKSKRFYFTDVLWGKSRNDCMFANYLVHKVTYNSTFILRKKSDIDSLIKMFKEGSFINDNTKLLSQFGLFKDGVTLLPFDLLLKGPENLTLFEHNVSVLLQNELKIDRENKI